MHKKITSTTGVHASVDASIIVQVLTGVIGLWGLLWYKLDGEHRVLHSVLLMETIVQFIELAFYVVIIRWMHVSDMARVRYYDWFLTTPTMLLTTIVYMAYEMQQENKTSPPVQFSVFARDNARIIAILFTSNFAMLLCGFLAELGVIDFPSAAVVGFAFFAVTFYVIWEKYAKHSHMGTLLFKPFAIVWACYGIAFMLPVAAKNVCYNFLDIVAKNFFGLFLIFKIQSSQRL